MSAQGARDRTTDQRHEARGSAWLAGLFPPAVTAPIALHVRAKRYLCAVDPSYLAVLSPGSVASLERQGGPLSADEVAAFEANPGWADAVALRRWDDQAKVPDLTGPTRRFLPPPPRGPPHLARAHNPATCGGSWRLPTAFGTSCRG